MDTLSHMRHQKCISQKGYVPLHMNSDCINAVEDSSPCMYHHHETDGKPGKKQLYVTIVKCEKMQYIYIGAVALCITRQSVSLGPVQPAAH